MSVIILAAAGFSMMAHANVRGGSVTLLCHVETIQHLNCGGGLRPVNAPPPDCTNFVSERSLGTRIEKVLVPVRDLNSTEGFIDKVSGGMIARSKGGKIGYTSIPNFYTDAAGFSVDRGSCSVAGRKRVISHYRVTKK